MSISRPPFPPAESTETAETPRPQEARRPAGAGLPQQPTQGAAQSIKVKVNPRVASDRYATTGLASVDAEHDTIRKLLIDVAEAAKNAARVQAGEALDAVLDTVKAHFRHEERLMAASLYPKSLSHTEAHAAFVADVERFRELLATQGTTVDFRKWATGRLSHWFRYHVVDADLELGRYLVDRARESDPAPTP